MVKAIIFDCFGVLATEAWLPFKAKYFGDNPDLFEQASALGQQADRGLMSHSNFLHAVADLAGISSEEARSFIGRNVPNEPLFRLITELKKTYKIGFLSNIADDYLRQMFSQEQLSLFDKLTLSYKSGYIKPQGEAYQQAADDLGIDPKDCVMIDDQERNITGAREAGMQAILYDEYDKFKSELDELLAASN
jgi:putative hydrolase of the HAD superfamily